MKKTVLIAALICLFALPFAYGQIIPNAGFETWTTHGSGSLTYPVPNGWSTIDSFTAAIPLVGGVGFVTKDSINPHGGTYDIKLQSKSISTSVVPGVACSGIIHLISVGPPATYNVLGGFPVSSLPATLKGWYRDSITGTDTSVIVAIFTKWNAAAQKRDTVAHGGMKIGASVLTWTNFSFPIMNDSLTPVAPDSGVVILYSGMGVGGVVGTTLWVDDLSFVTGINEIDPLNANYDLYPNPVAGTLFVKNNNFFKKEGFINIYDEMGRKVSTSSLNDNTTAISTKSLAKGMYFYEITTSSNTIAKKGKFVVEQ